MAQQIPLAQFGLEEAAEQYMVNEINQICQLYTGQQPDAVISISVASLNNKIEVPKYPFIGVRVHMPNWDPSFVGDLESIDPDTGFEVYSKVNDIIINLHLEAREYRQLQRLYSYLLLTAEASYDPLTDPVNPELYLSKWRNWGIIVNGWTASPVSLVTQSASIPESQPQKFPRTDLDTLWVRDVNIDASLATRMIKGIGIPIVDISENLTIKF